MQSTKLQKLGFIAIVFLFELLFYVFYSGSNMIIAVLPQDFEVRLLPYLFMNITVFLSFFAIFLKFTGTKIFCGKTLAAAAVVLAAKCVSDVIFALIKPEEIYRYFICDIFHIVIISIFMTAVSIIRRKDFKPEKTAVGAEFLKKTVAFAIPTGCQIILCGVFAVFFDAAYSKYDIEKIVSEGGYDLNFSYYINGANELYGIISVFIRTAIFAGAVCLFNYLHEHGENENSSEENVSKPFGASCAVLALSLALNLCLNTDAVFSGISSESAVFEKTSGQITADYKIFNLYRGLGNDRFLQYTSEKNYVYFGEAKVCTFKTDPLAACGWFVDYGDEEQTSIVCQNEAVAYINENGNWETVRFGELENAHESEKLTEVLKNVCETGSFEAIDRALPYFEKYEPEYIDEIKNVIKDDINEYSSGNWLLSEEYCTGITEKINSL